MTSLGEVYGGEGRREVSLHRLYAGFGLFAVGVLLVVAGIVVTTTGLLRGGGTTLFDVREYGGILAGIGVPAVLFGILTVLPASRRTRAAAAIGAAISVLGVGLFVHAYPCRWSGASCAPGMPNLTLPTVGVYFLGAAITFWYLFVGVANFKRRNDPGGTVTMEITRQGETRVVEVDRSRLSGLGGVGLLGGTPDGQVETQTNDASSRRNGGGPGPTTTASDGGSATTDVRSPLDGPAPEQASGPASSRSTRPQGQDPTAGGAAEDRAGTPTDTYCGNCRHFEYVRTDRGIQPYCGRFDELMDDMDACDEWTPRG